MKARVFRVYKNYRHQIEYSYVNTAKFRDDTEAWYKYTMRTPMMDIGIIRDDGSIGSTFCAYATRELLKRYTGFDIFDSEYNFFMEGKVLDIEFEWIEIEYPYLESAAPRDRIVSHKIKFPSIKMIKNVYLEF